MISIAIALYVAGFLLAFGFEAMTLYIRLAGAQLGRNAYAGFLVTACMLGNRLGASLLFPAGGFLLDKAYPTDGFLTLYSVAAVSMAAVLLIMLLSQLPIVGLLRRLFPESQRSQSVAESARSGAEKDLANQKISRPVVILTTTLNQLGIFLPVLIASMYLDYRATIVQLGFLINSIGTIVTIFFVEKKIALHAEYSPEELGTELKRLLGTRALVLVFMGAVSLICALFLVNRSL